MTHRYDKEAADQVVDFTYEKLSQLSGEPNNSFILLYENGDKLHSCIRNTSGADIADALMSLAKTMAKRSSTTHAIVILAMIAVALKEAAQPQEED